MRIAAFILILAHGLLHLLGVARAYGLAELPELTHEISTRAGVVWGLAAAALAATAVLYLVAPRSWWLVGLPAVVLSQALVMSTWSDSRFGTLANVAILLLAVHGFAAYGPLSLRARYERGVREALAAVAASPSVPAIPDATLSDEDLRDLPEAARRYVRRSGAVGQPVVHAFRARWQGRIRGAPDEAWMSFTAEQYNVVEPPTRLFFMSARKAGLPVDVLHVYREGEASMTVRLLSLAPLVRAHGAELTRAETVTLLNDLAILAPGALAGERVHWTSEDDGAVAAYTVHENTVSARFVFDADGDLVDFVSEDRLVASADGTSFTRMPWSTPLGSYRSFGPRRAATVGTGLWHPPGEPEWSYIELELTDLQANPAGLDFARPAGRGATAR